MIDALPFLALPLALALRRAPLLTLAFGAISAATMFVATTTVPQLPESIPTSSWWHRFAHGSFAPLTGSGGILWFGLLAVVALGIAAVLAPRPRIDRRQVLIAVVGLAGWVVVERVGGLLLHPHATPGELALIAIVAAVSLVTWRAVYPMRRIQNAPPDSSPRASPADTASS
jgi:hypothetical protein